MKPFSFKITVLLLAIMALVGCVNTKKNMVNTETVKQLDLERYLGQWYEIARFPNSFEKNLVGVTAHYSMRDDGKIKVVNRGYKNSLTGPLSEAVGKAKIPNPNEPAKLKVAFFWIFYADYFVMELDQEDYQWAVIGSKSDQYLWILSRTPQMEQSLYNGLIEKIKARGYDISKLYLVPQKTTE